MAIVRSGALRGSKLVTAHWAPRRRVCWRIASTTPAVRPCQHVLRTMSPGNNGGVVDGLVEMVVIRRPSRRGALTPCFRRSACDVRPGHDEETDGGDTGRGSPEEDAHEEKGDREEGPREPQGCFPSRGSC